MTLAIISGGLDSAVLAYTLEKLVLVSFDYGQRHVKEIEHAEAIARSLGLPLSVIDISTIGRMLSGSALTDDVDVPDGRYDDKSMAVTIVPNRNAILLSIAYGVAVARGLDAVAIGVHAGDHAIYPDCRLEFIQQFEAMAQLATASHIAVVAPFVNKTKAEIVKLGNDLGVPFELTWSCYKGREIHCGVCGTCYERREAFELAGVVDPTIYASTG